MKHPNDQLAEAMAADKKARGGGRSTPRAKWTRDERGRNHPSDGEAQWFNALYAAERRGEIRILDIEPEWRITITGAGGAVHELCRVKADAKVQDVRTGVVTFDDYKGKSGDLPLSRLKHKMVELQHGVRIRLVGRYVEQKAKAKARKTAERELLRRSRMSAKGRKL